MSGVPEGWEPTTLAELSEVITKGTTPKTLGFQYQRQGVRFVKVESLANGSIDHNACAYIEEVAHMALRRSQLKEDDVLFTIAGTLGRVATVTAADLPANTNQAVAIIRLKEPLLAPYVALFSVSEAAKLVESGGRGTGLQNLNLEQLGEFAIRVPPLPEQLRIVAKIDSLTGKSKRARDHLDHIPRLVEKYKQAVLAAAFRGELVGLATAKTELPHDRCWDLPSSWRWVRFSEVVEIASNLVKPEEIPDLPHIAPDNVEGGTGRLLPYSTIREDAVISAKHRFFAGQVIYSKIRPYLRKAVLVDFDGACSADMYPLTATVGLDPTYLLYWLISEPFAGFTVEHEGRTVLPKINQQGLNQTPFPMPPLVDQKELVRRLRSAFTWIDRLATEATSARKLIDRLDQALLAKAFRGELVPQDPTDEPASLLLERIKAEHGAAPKPKRGRKAKVGV